MWSVYNPDGTCNIDMIIIFFSNTNIIWRYIHEHGITQFCKVIALAKQTSQAQYKFPTHSEYKSITEFIHDYTNAINENEQAYYLQLVLAGIQEWIIKTDQWKSLVASTIFEHFKSFK